MTGDLKKVISQSFIESTSLIPTAKKLASGTTNYINYINNFEKIFFRLILNFERNLNDIRKSAP